MDLCHLRALIKVLGSTAVSIRREGSEATDVGTEERLCLLLVVALVG